MMRNFLGSFVVMKFDQNHTAILNELYVGGRPSKVKRMTSALSARATIATKVSVRLLI